MKFTKKLLCLLAALVLAISTAACSGKSDSSSKKEEATTEVTTEITTTTKKTTTTTKKTTTEASTTTTTQKSVSTTTQGTVTQASTQAVQNNNQSSQNNQSVQTTQSQSSSGNATQSAGTPYATHGALSVNGTDLVDKNGNKFQLYGMSTHGIAWYPQYVSYDTFKTLRDDWNTNCVRLAMYTYEYNGYCSGGDKEWLKSLVSNGVDYATQLGMYVIIDWHVLNDQNPLTYKDEAKSFFAEMSSKYAGYDNVIYEICNEPNSSASWSDISSYANEIIPVIRANDANSIIIVGTPTWSQDIDQALSSPLNYSNVMYALHFYAATHTDWLRNRLQQCKNSGLPIIISEFGTCDASGSGSIDYTQSQAWKDLIDQNNLSYMCWNLSNKGETSSVIASGCSKVSGWSESELTDQGKLVRSWFKGETQ